MRGSAQFQARSKNLAIAALVLALGCSSKSKVTSGNGGTGGGATGGASGRATGGLSGTAGSGGAGGAAWVAPPGGAAEIGGNGGTGGIAGVNGVADAGGTAGSGGAAGAGGTAVSGGAVVRTELTSVLEHHGDPSRDGAYIAPKLTKAAAATVHVDPTFANATVAGPTYAQPLYLAGVGGGPDLVLAATEQDHVYAFNAANSALVWDRPVGTPVPLSQLPCGHIDPLGITGTPVIDPATRTIYLDAMTTPDAGPTKKHLVFAVDADTGATRSGWPVDVGAVARANGLTFDSSVQNQRGALALVDGTVLVPFGGFAGDCGNYHGWVVAISATDPTHVAAWSTGAGARGGGIWGPAGISSDGESVYFATGNTFGATAWQGSEAFFKLPSTLAFDGDSMSYFLPANWMALDQSDLDMGGTAPILLSVPGATPSDLVVGIGKDANAYVLDRHNLGGTAAPLAVEPVGSQAILTASAGYATPTGTYVVFSGNGSVCPAGPLGVTAFKITPTAPPTVSIAWCAGPGGPTAPAVSMIDAAGHEAIVWMVTADYKLRGFDGETGQIVFNGGAPSDVLPTVQKFQTPIIVKGRIFVAAGNQVFAFTTN